MTDSLGQEVQSNQQRTLRLLTLCIQETQTTEHLVLRCVLSRGPCSFVFFSRIFSANEYRFSLITNQQIMLSNETNRPGQGQTILSSEANRARSRSQGICILLLVAEALQDRSWIPDNQLIKRSLTAVKRVPRIYRFRILHSQSLLRG
jgi:hypothetical protein